MTYTAGDVMDLAAATLNDAAKSLYTYVAQLPFLKMATQDLEQELDLVGSPINLISEAVIDVAADANALALPESFFLPVSLGERQDGVDDDFAPMTEVANIFDVKSAIADNQTTTLDIWDYRHNCINFIPASRANEVRLTYWRTLTEIIDENSLEVIKGAKNALAYRTAAMCARFIGGNQTRADVLDTQAAIAFDRLTSLTVKNNQGKRVRRKPFRTRGRTLLARIP